MENESDGAWYYEQLELGLNYRMTDLQAALGDSQMQRLKEFINFRHYLANRYYELLADLPLVLPYQLPTTYSSLHLFVIRLKLNEINLSHKEVFSALRESGIGVNLHYIPVYRHPYYTRIGFDKSEYPNAEEYYATAISIPIFHGMTDSEQNKVVSVLTNILVK
jgi:dTDP-4-amino-4,6-dideoxygalactose transaminase